ncbi:MAG: hypothetical protein AAFY03_13720, partial [Pseudomonadota bacterium]
MALGRATSTVTKLALRRIGLSIVVWVWLLPGVGAGLTIDDFSRDRSIFDSGLAQGLNKADIPLSGRASPGDVIEVRVITEDGEEVVPWHILATAGAKGDWAGDVRSERHRSWLRPEVRVRARPNAVVRTSARFGVGHVFAIFGQSNDARQVNPRFSLIEPEQIVDEEAVQLVYIPGIRGASDGP